MAYDYQDQDLYRVSLFDTKIGETISLYQYVQPSQLDFNLFAVCLRGTMKVIINGVEYKVIPNDCLISFTGTSIEITYTSPDLRMSVICFSENITSKINLLDALGDVYFTIKDFPVLSLRSEIALYMSDYFSYSERFLCDFLSNIDKTSQGDFLEGYSELLLSSYNTVLLGIRLAYKSHVLRSRATTRKEELSRDLIQLAKTHYVTQRRAQFYANELGVTLQYLSTTVKEVTGKNVLDIIAYVVIIDAKSKLRSTRMNVLEIATSLNFPSVSLFDKYFKRHTGLTPLEYRKTY